jgi:hypothetical protein
MLPQMTVKSTVAHDYRESRVSFNEMFRPCDTPVSARHKQPIFELPAREV